MIKTVYIAGPYTGPDPERNVESAIRIAETVSRMEMSPYIPHLHHYWNKMYPHDYKFWMEQDLVWLQKCDGFLLFDESPGALKELEYAISFNKRIFRSVGEIGQYYLDNQPKVGL